jgi:hypothetical protein
MKKFVVSLVWAVFAVAAAAAPLFAQDFKPADWLEDFAQLKREMSAHYANLEWTVEHRGLDLKKLSDETEASLQKASARAEAQAAIENFLRNFGDSHLRVEWASNSNQGSNSEPFQRGLCERLGYGPNRFARPGVAFSGLKNYRELANEGAKYLPAGVLSLSGGKKVGVIRIALFMESQFPDLCRKAVAAERNLTENSECDGNCAEKINRRVSDLLTEQLAAQVSSLKREKIDALLIDLTANGGGTNWYEPAARTLTPKPLRSIAFGFIRHPHWTKQFRDRLTDIETALAKSPPEKLKKILAQAAENARADLQETQKSCDRSGLWENRKLDCSLVAVARPALPYARPGELPDEPISQLLFGASYYKYTEGVYAGKLLILIDQRTASSSEAFTAMLRDNDAAAVIGQPSAGAGCGYTNGGIETVLKNSGARVRMPDCVRFRADGSNEVGGITPDVMIPWRPNDTPFQKAKRTVEALEKIF